MKKIFAATLLLLTFLSGINFAEADSVRLLDAPADGLQARLDLIAEAKKTIDAEYHSTHEDYSTELIWNALLEAADRGVRVRFVTDSFTHGMSSGLLALFAEHPNIELYFYEPLVQIWRPASWNSRLHDKLLLVDGEKMIVGGRNLGDKYFGFGDERQSRDRDVIIFGDKKSDDTSLQASEYFAEMWHNEMTSPTYVADELARDCSAWWRWSCRWSQKIYRQRAADEREKIENSVARARVENPEFFEHDTDWQAGAIVPYSVTFVHDPVGAKRENNGTAAALYDIFRATEDSLLIQTPYLVPTPAMSDALLTARDNGAEITILTNSVYSSPNPFGIAGTQKAKRQITRNKLAEFWETQDWDSLHCKAYLADSYTSVVGSFNLDYRSARANTEMFVVIESSEFAEQLRESFEFYKSTALPIDADGATVETAEFPASQPSVWKKIGVGTMTFFSPLYRTLL